MVIYYLSTLAGWALGTLTDLSTRNRWSPRSPQKFSISFWIKDNYRKWGISLGSAMLLTWVASHGVTGLMDAVFEPWMALVIGFAPDAVLSFLKQRFGILQPEQVGEFDRTTDKPCN